MDSLVGKTFSHYRIIERIGAGGMGVVYKAEDTKLGRTVALKFLSPEMTRDEKAKLRFIQEARAASAMEHSNICTIFEVDEIEDDRIFIAMAYYAGKTLKDRIAEGPLPLRDAVEIAAQVAQGLVKAHANGIVHRDIKPGNIFLTEDREVKIVDFGLAKLAGQAKLTTTGKTMGTVSYMSPEQASGKETGPKTDLWSLGVMLYEMVAGELPFKGDYELAVIYSIMNDAAAPLGDIRPGTPEVLQRIVSKTLAKNEAERYGSAAELLADLNALKQELDFQTFTGTHEWKFKGKERRWTFGVAAAVVVMAAAIAIWLVSRSRNEVSGLPGTSRQVTSGDTWHAEPALSPDGNRIAYASDESGNKDIYVISVRGGNPVRITDDPAPDYYPAWFPDGTSIAFVSERGGAPGIWKVDQMGGGATLILKNAIEPAISPDGLRIACTAILPSAEQRIAVAPLANPSAVQILTHAGDGLWEHRVPAWSPDGKWICYATRPDLWIVPSSGGKARRVTMGGGADFCPTWSPGGKYIYFSSGREGTVALWRVPARGGLAKRLTTGFGNEHDPSISADGSKLAFWTQTEPGLLIVRDLESGHETKLPGARGHSIAAISPDGSKVVYASNRTGASYDLWVQALDHGLPVGQPQRLTEDSANASCPMFSPDGKWIAYYRIDGKRRDIFTIPVSGGRPIPFLCDSSQNAMPAWSDDGKTIAYVSDRGGAAHIWAQGVSEGKPVGTPRRVTDGTKDDGGPVWSHDGKRIAYVAESDGVDDVWVIPADGSAPARRVTNGANATMVRWDKLKDVLLVSGKWKGDLISLRRISLGGKEAAPIDPPVEFGNMEHGTFDISRNGRFIVFGRESNIGNVWVQEAKKHAF
jgi:Tol biopolymer transport system component/predicted Ser/Thr protein kinase